MIGFGSRSDSGKECEGGDVNILYSSAPLEGGNSVVKRSCIFGQKGPGGGLCVWREDFDKGRWKTGCCNSNRQVAEVKMARWQV
jgi:hypothetical protein